MAIKIGDLVHYVEIIEGEAKRIPALVTAVYDDAHGEVVTDLLKLKADLVGIITKDNVATAPDGTPTASHVDPDTSADVTSTTPAPAPLTAAQQQAADDAKEIAALKEKLAAAEAKQTADEAGSSGGVASSSTSATPTSDPVSSGIPSTVGTTSPAPGAPTA